MFDNFTLLSEFINHSIKKILEGIQIMPEYNNNNLPASNNRYNCP